jgi:hypothetical protein
LKLSKRKPKDMMSEIKMLAKKKKDDIGGSKPPVTDLNRK